MPDSPEYKKFRTGLTFQDIYQMLWSYSDDPKHWPKGSASSKMRKDGSKKTVGRRHTVLGKWREIKLEMWHKYKNSEA